MSCVFYFQKMPKLQNREHSALWKCIRSPNGMPSMHICELVFCPLQCITNLAQVGCTEPYSQLVIYVNFCNIFTTLGYSNNSSERVFWIFSVLRYFCAFGTTTSICRYKITMAPCFVSLQTRIGA